MIWSSLRRTLIASALCLAPLFGVANAQSVPNMPFPAFHQGQYCYVARPVTNVNCGDLDDKLRQVSNGLTINGHHVDVFTVFVREPDSGIPQFGSTPPGGVVAETIAGTWRTKGAQAGFPVDDYVLLVLTQHSGDPSKWLMAMRWGGDVNPYFSFPQMKTILDNHVQDLRTGDYRGYVVGVTSDAVTQIGTRVNSANRPSSPPVVQYQPRPETIAPSRTSEPSEPFNWTPILLILLVGAAGGGAIIFFKGAGAGKRKYQEAVADIQPILDGLQTQVDTLVNSYDGLAMGKKTYAAGSESAKQYQAALLISATYFAHADALKAQRAVIDAAVAKGKFGDATTAVNATIEITGEELPPELRTATSGRFKKESHTYRELALLVAQEFDNANSVFGKLYTSLTKTMANKRAVEAELVEVATSKDVLTAAGVSFATYGKEHDAITAGIAAFVSKADADPLGAFAESETLKSRVAALHQGVKEALELTQSVKPVSDAISALRTKVTKTRTSAVTGFPSGLLLNEKGGNPDDAVTAAQSNFQAMQSALKEGDVPAAQKAKDAAMAAVTQGGEIVDGVISACSTVAGALGKLNQLGSESGAAFIQRSYEKQDFLAAAAALEVLQNMSALTGQRDKIKGDVVAAAIFVTKATEQAFATASGAVDSIVDRAKQVAPDWTDIANRLHGAETSLADVTRALEADNKLFTDAKSSVSGLRRAYDDANAKSGDERVDQGANGPRGQLAPVAQKLQELEQAIVDGTNPNWATIDSQARGAAGTAAVVKKTIDQQIAEAEEYEERLQQLDSKYREASSASYSVRIPRTRQTYSSSASFTSAPQYASYQAHLDAAETYYRQRRWADLERERLAAQSQLDMMNTWMWWSLWNQMATSNDAWARQYAFDQGFQQGMAYDAYHDHVDVGSSGGWYQPTPVSQWTPSEPIPGSSGSSSSCGSSSSTSSSSSSSCSSSSSSSCSSSSSSSSCSSSSSSSSCGSSS